AYDAEGRVADESMNRIFGDNGAAAQKLKVPAGTFRVVIQMPGRDYATRIVTLSSPSQQTIGLTPGGTLVIHSSNSAARRAQLLDASGLPYDRSPFGNPP